MLGSDEIVCWSVDLSLPEKTN